MKKTTVCARCGKEFQQYPSESHLYCCRACSQAALAYVPIIKICQRCGKEFSDPKHPDKKYCSNECVHQSQERRITLTCHGCGNPFVVREKKHRQQFCSTTCRDKYQSRSARGKEKRICELCGKEFEAWIHRATRFCSNECRKKGYRNPEAHVTQNCIICGKAYTVTRFFVTKRTSKYCSVECRGIGTGRLMRGAGNVNYRGGTVEYRGRNWGSQRRKAIQRDGARCQICKHKIVRKAGSFGVHHIRPFRDFNGDWEAANQLSNLITLCSSCHAKVEFGELACPMPLL